MATIPTWLLGRHVTTVTIRYQVADSGGLLANGSSTTQTLTGQLDEIGYYGEDEVENITPITSEYENEVGVEANDSIVVGEILRQGTGNNLLAALWDNGEGADYAYFTFTRGGNSFSGYFFIADYDELVRKGKSTGRLVLEQADIEAGTANPLYS